VCSDRYCACGSFIHSFIYSFVRSFILVAATFGDPHIITLDGVQYTINGKGEYSILNIDPSRFTLQGRMEQLKDTNSIQINATVYTTFAMKENGSDTVQVYIYNPSNTG
jgi:hypothetical protein